MQETDAEIRTYFVRNRNAMVARGDFSAVLVDYYLHLSEWGLQPEAAHDELFKDLLGAFLLHCAVRPRNEMTAWTIHFERPLINLFFSCANADETVVGSIHETDVREGRGNLLFCDVVKGNRPLRRSVVDFEGLDPLLVGERFYEQSEQRTGRFFRYSEEDFVLVLAQPGSDEAWLEGLDAAAIRNLDQKEELVLLESRRYRWHCGCNQKRMLDVLHAVAGGDLEDLFDDSETLRLSCPRCRANHLVTREALEAHRHERQKPNPADDPSNL